MSTAGGSDAKYAVILEKLAELKALAEVTGDKVGVLYAEKAGKIDERQKKEKEEAERQRKVEEVRKAIVKEQAEEKDRKLREKEKAEKRLAEIEAGKAQKRKEQAQKDNDEKMMEYGIIPPGFKGSV
jgi:hypothetical protein